MLFVLICVLLDHVSSSSSSSPVLDNCKNLRWPSPASSFSPLCASAGSSVCQWSCALFNCSASSAIVSSTFLPHVVGSCGHLVHAAPNETLCTRRSPDLVADGCPSWFLDVEVAQTAWIDVGFANDVFASHVLVLESFTVGFVTKVQVFDNATALWLTGFDGAEQNRTPDATRGRLAVFPVPNHVRTSRVRLFINATLNSDQVNGIALVGSFVQPAPTPPTAPPTPHPLVEIPLSCPPLRRVQFDDPLDHSLGDEWCSERGNVSVNVSVACAFPCHVLACSWSRNPSIAANCETLIGPGKFSAYENENGGAVDWVALDFGAHMNATGLIVGFHGALAEAVPVLQISSTAALFDNATDWELVERTARRVWFFRFRNSANVRQLNITLAPPFSVGFFRLVGQVDPPLPRRRVPRRLPGRFEISQVPLANQVDILRLTTVPGRFDLLAPNSPPHQGTRAKWSAVPSNSAKRLLFTKND
jgi:hypothetical protein